MTLVALGAFTQPTINSSPKCQCSVPNQDTTQFDPAAEQGTLSAEALGKRASRLKFLQIKPI